MELPNKTLLLKKYHFFHAAALITGVLAMLLKPFSLLFSGRFSSRQVFSSLI